jgi:hypothetical protein
MARLDTIVLSSFHFHLPKIQVLTKHLSSELILWQRNLKMQLILKHENKPSSRMWQCNLVDMYHVSEKPRAGGITVDDGRSRFLFKIGTPLPGCTESHTKWYIHSHRPQNLKYHNSAARLWLSPSYSFQYYIPSSTEILKWQPSTEFSSSDSARIYFPLPR